MLEASEGGGWTKSGNQKIDIQYIGLFVVLYSERPCTRARNTTKPNFHQELAGEDLRAALEASFQQDAPALRPTVDCWAKLADVPWTATAGVRAPCTGETVQLHLTIFIER